MGATGSNLECGLECLLAPGGDVTPETALEKFEKWYQECLESGIAPEEIVDQVGEMKLLVNQEQIDSYERGLDGG